MRRLLSRSGHGVVNAVGLALCLPLSAFGQEAIWSGWGGLGVADDSALPIVPQFGVRTELAPVQRMWLGGELHVSLLSDDVVCPAGGGCGGGIAFLPTPSLSVFTRVEAGNERRPYVTGLYGRSISTSGSGTTPLWGIGLGLRAERAGTWRQFFVEGRYRRVERESRTFGDDRRVEILVGLGR